MILESRTEVARFETTRRLLSHLVNEGLCSAFTGHEKDDDIEWLCLTGTNTDRNASPILKVQHIYPASLTIGDTGRVISLIRPHQLKPPVLLLDEGAQPHTELDPGLIFKTLYPLFDLSHNECLEEDIAQELQNAAANQETWLNIQAQLPPLDLFSPAIDWERTLITGHPTHPLHKTLTTQPPLKPINPERIRDMLSPKIIFLSVPRPQVRTSGPFEDLLNDLLAKLEITNYSEKRIIVPCLSQQIPSITSRFSGVHEIGFARASAQASLRTVNLPSHLRFNYHLKLSLACRITSALRTITPWTALGGAEVSALLEKLLPPDLWVFKEIAAATGAQANFDDAKHLSCIFREDLELRANQQGEALIIASAFSQLPVPSINETQGGEKRKTHAESQFPTRDKLEWFKRKYTKTLLTLLLPPLVNHGIALEAHGQNICVRICRSTRQIKGFAIRDFGGIRLHMPTLREQGFDKDIMRSIPPGAATLTDDLSDVWSKTHHSLFQNHLGQLIVALGLDGRGGGGWGIVREEVQRILCPAANGNGEGLIDAGCEERARQLCGFLLGETMPFKCFLRMRMEGKYRDYVERQLPNVLLQ
ncbi:IucC family-domain-containing protein [Aspergillus stella-maris]|uniref:IucC family-domain-containing protein n=1 Tax=Aspergillus stella-maris TaxID=1810926 RepID=UPI003CCCC56C